VTIYGHNFEGATVEFNGVQATNVLVLDNGTHIQVNVPADASSGPIVVTANGGTVIYGMQCYFPKGIWMYVANRSGHAHWYDSNVPCSRKVWTAGVWHHVILKYHRDSAGNVTYDSVNFDTKVTKFIGASGPSDYGLGWGIGRLIVNFQIGGNKQSSGTTAYLKSLTVTVQ
jgi:hypothetical protein